MYCYLTYNDGGGGRERLALRKTPATEFKSLFNFTCQDTVFWDVNTMKSGTKARNFQMKLLPLCRTTVPQDSKIHAHCHGELQPQKFEMCDTFCPTYRHIKCYLSHLSYHVKANQMLSSLTVVGDTCYIS